MTSVGLIAPAATADPKLPDGCTFDKGQTTCVTSSAPIDNTQRVTHYEPGDTSSSTNDGSYAATFCRAANPGSTRYYDIAGPTFIQATGSRTTTTTYHGASAGNGNKPTSSTTHSTITYTFRQGIFYCTYPDGTQSAGYSYGDAVTVTN
ncbi:hypothetical protein GCM10027596_16680 [Nocardioides korecus]